MTRKQRRLTLIGLAGVVLATAAGLVLYALNDQIVFFQSPSDIAENQIPAGERIRLGGLVKDGSVVQGDNAQVSFIVTDEVETVAVSYTGLLPDLFREGQGIVAEGYIDPNGVFQADQVLAKHDENYIPKEVKQALEDSGHWMEEEQGAASYGSSKSY
ncbi:MULTISPECIES: cytochrome c maturation protein CcmE [Pseudovibrio]|uniref:cytochrome c maturation protein CcmE n=1 Tax=Stappiaceae TaxID=2821832 RepID=UPI002366D86C|nr:MULTISPECIES: cytochrome c maturation protein CcmE [Pseudovibrio]MDD7909128.1 cytochrome c maturation protein CcmE [Pseudovibrio exalbescens]MDX5595572.1 cytochrome c maturation protein CcmE [Pseudovibrio sp. SPO723]